MEIDDELEPRYNIAPSQTVAAVRAAPGGEGREFVYLNWGLIPSWAKDAGIANKLINARGETLTEKPSFREAFKRRPCLVVADGFFEWDKKGETKRPYYFQLRDGRPFAFAGLWERWASPDGDNVETCTIITTAPNELLAQVHDRMPVVLPPEEYDVWLDVDARKELLQPFPSSEMIADPVGTQVNSPPQSGPGSHQETGGGFRLRFDERFSIHRRDQPYGSPRAFAGGASFFAGEFAAFRHLRYQMENSLLQLAPKLLLFEPPPGSHHARLPARLQTCPAARRPARRRRKTEAGSLPQDTFHRGFIFRRNAPDFARSNSP